MFESEHIDEMIVVAHGAGPMTGATWARFMGEMRKKPISLYLAGCVGIPEPTSVQRNEIFAVLEEWHVKSVVITDERIVRGIVTAARWAGVNVDALAWGDLPVAVKQLGVTDPAKVAQVLGVMGRLRYSVERNSRVIRKVG
jgi:hypothetical protein